MESNETGSGQRHEPPPAFMRKSAAAISTVPGFAHGRDKSVAMPNAASQTARHAVRMNTQARTGMAAPAASDEAAIPHHAL